MKLNKMYFVSGVSFKINLFFVFFLILMLSGCSKQENSNSDESWKDEVLLMDECGSDGLKCCADQESQCFFGQTCCIDINNPERNYCADECSCGGLDEYCCENNECDSGLACNKGDCVVCGEEGNPCCVLGKQCLDQDSGEVKKTECIDNICIPCGYGGKNVCESGDKCVADHFVNNNKCLACGDYNQPCCINDEMECDADKGLKCELGFCL